MTPTMPILPSRISTIRQPARELGRTAVNIMMRLLNDDPDIPAETRLPVEWIGRDSIKIVKPVPKWRKSARFWRKKRSINNLFTIISKPVYRIVFN
jgi:hypothetical protein